ncbi:MAG: hypothetical protein PVJ02_12025 [Gemmatimonadota bacterium]
MGMRRFWAATAATAAAAVVAAGCGVGAGERPAAASVTSDSSGVLVVESTGPAWTEADARHLAASPRLEMGSVDGDPFLGRFNRGFTSGVFENGRAMMPAFHVTPSGELLDTLGVFPDADMGRVDGRPSSVLLGKRAVLLVEDTLWAVGTAEAYQVDEYDLAGRLVRRFLLGWNGDFWIREYGPPGEKGESWSVFGPDRRFLGMVAVPDGIRITDVADDYVVGVRTDGLDVPHVVVFDLLEGRSST